MNLKEYIELNESTKAKKSSIDDLKVELIDRYNKDKDVTLKELEGIAKKHKIDLVDVVETLSTILHNFLYRRKDIRSIKVDQEQLRLGTEHEKEHTSEKEIAKIIAKDHLAEVPDYYTRLKEIDDD